MLCYLKKRGFKQSPFSFLLLCLFSAMMSIPAFGGNMIVSDSLVFHGLEQTVLHRYDKAMLLWNALSEKGYDESETTFYKAATLQSKMGGLHNYSISRDDFLKISGDCIKMNKENLRRNPLNIRSLYFLGSMETSLSLYYVETNEWMKAAAYGLSGVSHLKKIRSINKNIKEVELFINIFKYYKHKLAEKTPIIPFVRDERKEAVRRVKEVVDTGINSFIGRNQLAWMLIDYEKFDEAAAVSLKGLSIFPGSRFYLWTAAESYKRKGDFTSAVPYYRQIRESLKKDSYINEYAYIKCLYKLLECYEALDDTVQSGKIVDEIFSLEIVKSKDKRVRKILKEVKQIKEKR